MDFGSRQTDPFTFISASDPALANHFSDEQIEAYLESRDIRDVPGILEKTAPAPMVVEMLPMRPEFERWRPTLSQPDSAWEIFKNHALDIPSRPDIKIRPGSDGSPKMRDSDRGKLDPILVMEAAIACAERPSRGGELPLPHTPPAMWRQTAIRSRLRHAANQRKTAQTDTD